MNINGSDEKVPVCPELKVISLEKILEVDLLPNRYSHFLRTDIP
jgi:hypothetical protein